MQRSPHSSALVARWLAVALLASSGAWLVAAAGVALETYDGYDALCSARALLGEGVGFVGNRAPLVPAFLAPVVALADAVGFHPLDPRPAHAAMAALHLLHLLASLWLIRRLAPTAAAALAAWAAAVPAWAFFSWAPFLSHDLFPGSLLLAMVACAHAHRERPRVALLIALVALGAAAALTKHILGGFWLVLLLASALDGLGAADRKAARRHLTGLALAAAASGVITWLVLASVLADAFPATSWLARPWAQLRFLAGDATGGVRFARWVYLFNAPAHGVVAVALVPFGLWHGLRRRGLPRLVALCWLGGAVGLHLLALREVRYFAALAPLTGAVIVAPTAWALSHRGRAVALGAALLLSLNWPLSIVDEAARVVAPAWRASRLQQILAPVGHGDTRRRAVVINWTKLDLREPAPSPLGGDPYHRKLHFGRHHLACLLGHGPGEVQQITPDQLSRLRTWPDDGAFVLARQGRAASRPDDSETARAIPRAGPRQILTALPATLTLRRHDVGFIDDEGGRASIAVAGESVRVTSAAVATLASRALVLALRSPDGADHLLRPQGPTTFVAHGLKPGLPHDGPWQIRALRVAALVTETPP